MNTDAIKRFFILSSKWEYHRNELYQLVQAAERYHYQKDLEGQLRVGRWLKQAAYPFSEIGKYYESLYLIGTGQYQAGEKQLEEVAEHAPDRYRAKAVLSLSASAEFQGNLDESLRLRKICTKMNDPVTRLEAQLAISVIYGISGDHNIAIKSIERFLPLARYTHPTTYGEFLNSYAVELNEVGRIAEAKNVISLVLTSPYISYYKTWQETGQDIYLKPRTASRSIISVAEINTNIVTLPVPQNRTVQSRPPKSAKVLSYMDWKEKKAKESASREFDKMSDKDLAIKIFELAAEDGMTWMKLRRIVDYILKVRWEPF